MCVTLNAQSLTSETPVWKVLEDLGEPPAGHQLGRDAQNSAEINAGKELFFKGRNIESPQSKFFNCIDCHNVKIEDPVLSTSDPDARLKFLWGQEERLPLLQGTTMAGVVNRTEFYNGIYQEKYGGVTQKASKDLIEAVQVCAEFCSQGRKYNEAELKSMMAYLWSLEWKMGDLGFSAAELGDIQNKVADQSQHSVLKELIKSKYLTASPATFLEPRDPSLEDATDGNAPNGRIVFEMSCLHCHGDQDDAPGYSLSMSSLNRGFDAGKTQDIIRKGIDPREGRKDDYMPYFTKERLSEQQMKDLRAYVAEMAFGNQVDYPGSTSPAEEIAE